MDVWMAHFVVNRFFRTESFLNILIRIFIRVRKNIYYMYFLTYLANLPALYFS